MKQQSAPIINRTTALALPTRIGWQLVAVLMWGAWIACWAPLATLAIWEFGLYQLNTALMLPSGLGNLQQVALPYVSIIVAQGAGLLGWASKDYVMYGRLQRRRQAPSVDLAELAYYAELLPAALAYWQNARCLMAEHDEHGHFRHALVHAASSPQICSDNAALPNIIPGLRLVGADANRLHDKVAVAA